MRLPVDVAAMDTGRQLASPSFLCLFLWLAFLGGCQSAPDLQESDKAPPLSSRPETKRGETKKPYSKFENPKADLDPSVCTSLQFEVKPNHVLCLDDVGTKVDLTDNDRSLITNIHNGFRATVQPPAADMLQLGWDEVLAMLATKVASLCLSNLDHLEASAKHSLSSFPGMYLSLNMAFGKSSWDGAIKSWFDERYYFEFGAGSLGNYSTLEYINMVAGTTSRLGCGHAFCSSIHENVYVCYYASEFEDGKQAYPYTAGSWCSLCQTCNPDGKLCNCNGRLCFNGGRVDTQTCTCRCFDNYKGNSCQQRTINATINV